jgi:hypothetical protein
MSARARKRALNAEGARLFPRGFWEQDQTEAERKEADIERLRRSAQSLRELADRGMSVRRFRRDAAKLDATADALQRADDERAES